MSKLLKIVIVLALLVFVLAPGVTGFLVESSIEKAESGYGQAIENAPFNIVGSDFKRGWFSSDQTLEVNVTDETILAVLHGLGGRLDLDETPTLVIETTATHGVIPLASPARGGLRPAVAQTESTFVLKYPDASSVTLPIRIYSSLGTGQWARLIADTVEVGDAQDPTYVNWDGADVSATFGDTSKYEGTVGTVNARTPEMSLSTTPVSVKGNFRKTQYEFDESESEIAFDEFKLTVPGPENNVSMVLNDLKAFGSLELDGDRVVIASNMTTGIIDNPVMPVKKTTISAKYNFDAASMSTIMAKANSSTSEDSLSQADTEALMAAFDTLITKGGNVTMDTMEIAFDEGTMSMTLDINLPPGSTSPLEAFANGTAAGNLVIPDAVVAALSAVRPELESGLAMASMMGFVEQKNGAYQAELVYENGVMLLNGLPVPLPF